MINEWIANHKKLALVAAVGFVVLVLMGIFFFINALFSAPAGEEKEPINSITASNLEVLYGTFSDSTIGYILNTTGHALSENMSMKNGQPLSNNTATPSDEASDTLYPYRENGEHSFTVVDGKVDYFEDDWGMWNTFTVLVSDGRRFKVDVAIGAHNRVNDVGYIPITITKL